MLLLCGHSHTKESQSEADWQVHRQNSGKKLCNVQWSRGGLWSHVLSMWMGEEALTVHKKLVAPSSWHLQQRRLYKVFVKDQETKRGEAGHVCNCNCSHIFHMESKKWEDLLQSHDSCTDPNQTNQGTYHTEDPYTQQHYREIHKLYTENSRIIWKEGGGSLYVLMIVNIILVINISWTNFQRLP